MPTRDDAWALLCEWTQSEALRKHGLAVEGAVGVVRAEQVRQERRRARHLACGRVCCTTSTTSAIPRRTRCRAPTSCAHAATRRSWCRRSWATATTPASRVTTELAHAVYALRRDDRLRHRRRAGAAEPEPGRGRRARGQEEDEGQGLCPPGAARPAGQGGCRGWASSSMSTSQNVIEGMKTVRDGARAVSGDVHAGQLP